MQFKCRARCAHQALAFASELNQHDIYAYMQLFGGPRIFERKLDELFTTSSVLPRGCAAGHCRHGRSVRARQRGLWPDERMESVCGRSAARRSFTWGFAQSSIRHRSRGSSACFRPVGGRRAFHGRHERGSCAQPSNQRQCCDEHYGSAAECRFFRPSWTLTGREALLLRQRIPPLHFPGSARIDSSAAVGLATIQTKALCSSSANMNSVFIFK